MSALLLRFEVNYLLFSRHRPFKKKDNKVDVSLILPPPGLSSITNFMLYTPFCKNIVIPAEAKYSHFLAKNIFWNIHRFSSKSMTYLFLSVLGVWMMLR